MHPDSFEWLLISVELLDSDSDDFALQVTFENCSTNRESVCWTFRNVLGKAESLSLHLRSMDGCRLQPAEYMSGTPAERKHEEFRFGAKQTYVLRGRIERGNLLRLGGASYFVEPGEEYEVSFQYGRVCSNIVRWTAPRGT